MSLGTLCRAEHHTSKLCLLIYCSLYSALLRHLSGTFFLNSLSKSKDMFYFQDFVFFHFLFFATVLCFFFFIMVLSNDQIYTSSPTHLSVAQTLLLTAFFLALLYDRQLRFHMPSSMFHCIALAVSYSPSIWVALDSLFLASIKGMSCLTYK